jgi:hypothetical protein
VAAYSSVCDGRLLRPHSEDGSCYGTREPLCIQNFIGNCQAASNISVGFAEKTVTVNILYADIVLKNGTEAVIGG